jgi:hypothetical protein
MTHAPTVYDININLACKDENSEFKMCLHHNIKQFLWKSAN